MPLSGLAWVVLMLAAGAGDARPAHPPGIGDPAPPLLDVKPLNGGTPAPRSFAGAVTVVDFFATWCQPCHEALRDLTALRGALGPDVQVVLIDVGEDPATVRRFFTATPALAGALVLVDPRGAVARAWGQDRFPTTFLLDRDGVIRHINRGWGGGYRERVGRWLRAMLAGRGP